MQRLCRYAAPLLLLGLSVVAVPAIAETVCSVHDGDTLTALDGSKRVRSLERDIRLPKLDYKRRLSAVAVDGGFQESESKLLSEAKKSLKGWAERVNKAQLQPGRSPINHTSGTVFIMASLIDRWRNDTSFEESLVRQIEEQAAERERQMQAARRLSRSRRDAMQREADRLRDWAFQHHIILIYDPTCGTAPEAYEGCLKRSCHEMQLAKTNGESP
jgi:hypothetical protein